MGAINYASAFSPKVAEAFSKESLTDSATGKEYSFSGNKTVRVFTVDTVPLNNYSRTGTNRYGTPVELGDTVQELVMGDDKAFTMTIDKGNFADQLNVKGAARALKRETEQVVIPYIDKYRFAKWAKGAGIIEGLSAPPAKDTIVELIFDAGAEMDNRLVPAAGRTLFIPNTYYKLLALSEQFIGVDKLGEQALSKGVVGEVDGMTVKRVPDSYFPANVYFMVKWKGSSADPVKLQDAKIHQDPPGLSGNLLEGRIYHDAFVLGAKADGIYVAAAASAVAEMPAIQISGGSATITCDTGSAVIRYTTDGSDPRYSATAQVYSAAVPAPAGTTVRAYAGTETGYPSAVAQATATE